jgi:beta-glucanase (GH16 family)
MKTFRWMSNHVAKASALVLCGAAMAACTANASEPSQGDNASEASQKTESVDTSSAALTTDFLDNFDGTALNSGNWQAQVLWVNNELQCYDNNFNINGGNKTVDVGGGTLKLRVVDSGTVSNCDNWDKNGAKHPNTRYKGGRIASKNRKEFARGRFTARLKLYTWKTTNTVGQASGVSGMFPAWWLLGYRNNEAPVQESNENVCWPMSGSGEIDIFEHYGNNGQNGFAARGIKNLGYCNGGDWQVYQKSLGSDLSNFHEYQVDYSGSDMIYRIDNGEVGRTSGISGNYTEPMFMVLNYALNSNMASGYNEYAMEIDWARHEY